MTDVTADSGIDMLLTSGRMPSTQILEVKGNGLALIDFNNNGLLDLFVPNGATMDDTEHGPGWRLYENLGGMRFRDVSEEAGITQTRWALGAAVGDFTGNGYDDVYVTCYGRNVLLLNQGDGTFEDATDAAGAAVGGWSTSAAFGDVNASGLLDLYVVNYVVFDVDDPPPPATFLGTPVPAGPRGLPGEADHLFLNDGGSAFRDVTAESGCAGVPPSYGLGVVIMDFNDNGRQDMYVGNDSMRNFLFRNDGVDENGLPRFTDVGVRSGIASNAAGNDQATMGIAIADLNGNALPDVFTTNFSSDTNTMHVNLGDLFFEDQTGRWGLGTPSRPYLGWAAGFYDLNLDGYEELFMVNGHIYPHATLELMDSEYEQPPLLFVRQGDDASQRAAVGGTSRAARFQRVTDPAAGDWLFTPRRDRAAVFGDLNNNGLIDMITGEMNGPIRVLRNDSRPAGPPDGWLIVELRDGRDGIGNHRGLGSRVQLTAGESDRALTRWIYGGGFMSASAQYAHFGIPPAWITEGRPLRLRITWPDGHVQEVDDVEPGQRVTIQRDG